jgi:hypothetical protein
LPGGIGYISCGGGNSAFILANGFTIRARTGGTTNRGGGAGGGAPAASGGSGVVIVRYLDSFSNAVVTGSPTFANVGGYKIYTFNGAGTITF